MFKDTVSVNEREHVMIGSGDVKYGEVGIAFWAILLLGFENVQSNMISKILDIRIYTVLQKNVEFALLSLIGCCLSIGHYDHLKV